MPFLLDIIARVTGSDPEAVREKVLQKELYSKDPYLKFRAAGGSDEAFYLETDAYIHELVNW